MARRNSYSPSTQFLNTTSHTIDSHPPHDFWTTFHTIDASQRQGGPNPSATTSRARRTLSLSFLRGTTLLRLATHSPRRIAEQRVGYSAGRFPQIVPLVSAPPAANTAASPGAHRVLRVGGGPAEVRAVFFERVAFAWPVLPQPESERNVFDAREIFNQRRLAPNGPYRRRRRRHRRRLRVRFPARIAPPYCTYCAVLALRFPGISRSSVIGFGPRLPRVRFRLYWKTLSDGGTSGKDLSAPGGAWLGVPRVGHATKEVLDVHGPSLVAGSGFAVVLNASETLDDVCMCLAAEEPS